MWIFLDDVAVFKRARFRLVRVANQINRFLLIGLDETPFHAARKSGTPAPAQTGIFHLVDDAGAGHLQRFLQLLVTAVFEVSVDVDLPISTADVFENQATLKRVRGCLMLYAWCLIL